MFSLREKVQGVSYLLSSACLSEMDWCRKDFRNVNVVAVGFPMTRHTMYILSYFGVDFIKTRVRTAGAGGL